jgi:hypothetical protein
MTYGIKYHIIKIRVLVEEIDVSKIKYRLIKLLQYESDLKKLVRLEPKLHEEIRDSIRLEVESGKLDEIKGTGGWIKGRAKSPSRNIGKSGGFRFTYLLFRVQHDIYLFSIYDHRNKLNLDANDLKELKKTAEGIKKAYQKEGGDR